MTRRRDLPPGLGEAFAVRDARASGVTARRLDARDLEAPFRGSRIRVTNAPSLDRYELREYELRRRAQAYVPVAPRDAAFSHVTAARLLGMPLPERLFADELHVTTSGQPPRRKGVAAHRSLDARRIEVRGFAVIPAEVVWLQLAPLLTLEELIEAGDHLVRRKRPPCTLDSLAAEIVAARGRRGVTAAAAALPHLRAGTDSPRETRMRRTIVHAGFLEPAVGFRAHHEGAFIGTPDLAYPEYRIAFEYQGGGHREEDVFEEDIDRLERFHEAGWAVVQVTKGLLERRGWLAERTRRALLSRGWSPSSA
ncbi:hypothetical protein HDC94_000353 [Leifsonia sp. AK011]|uniref:hypothetical protein n=1 Tax=Leifsonia sp. AK011 TaxID=2723075 RepID=UPI0015C6A414|nr:hypothetical protein [Leifsonia sp. AK011]NYF09197.1 hypothetical protein [Leifsonia sp. AK011]